MAKVGGGQSQFTYDFGIAVAQGTVNKVAKLAGVSLTLASAFYALNSTAKEYVETLKANTIRFGGVINAMRQMEEAQKRLLRGESFFNVKDQMAGMNQLAAAGVDAKKNFDFINKAAHASGQSFTQFATSVRQAIAGNMGGLVEMGLMTERSTRMFEKYGSNTIMRLNAIMEFLKNHKGLQAAIRNDFRTVNDEVRRTGAAFTIFKEEIIGKPNDKGSLYSQVRGIFTSIADAFKRNEKAIREYGKGIGVVLSWVASTVGKFIMWLGRQAKKVANTLFGTYENFADRMRTFVVWLEFWRLKIADFFKKYGDLIWGVIKTILIFKALKYTFIISKAAIASVIAYGAAWDVALAKQQRYYRMINFRQARVGGAGNKVANWFQSLAALMPKWFRGVWVALGKGFYWVFVSGLPKIGRLFMDFFKFKWLTNLFKGGGIFKSIANIFTKIPWGTIGRIFMWIFRIGKWLVAGVGGVIAAVVGFLALLYAKWKPFRDVVNNLGRIIWNGLKIVWNKLVDWYITIRLKLREFGEWCSNLGSTIWDGIKSAAARFWEWFQGTALYKFFAKIGNWIGNAWQKVKGVAKEGWQEWKNYWGPTGMGGMGWYEAAYDFGKAADNMAATSANMAQRNWDRAQAAGISIPGGDPSKKNKPEETPKSNDVGAIPIKTEEKKKEESKKSENPILSESDMDMSEIAKMFGGSDFGSSSDSPVINVSPNAININLNGADGIDENKLAQKIREVLLDMEREGKKRSGL